MTKRPPPIRCAAFALAGLLVSAAFGAGTARADDWGTPGLDAGHSRLSAERSGATFGDGRWSYAAATGARALASPVEADGFLISAGLDGTVTALHAESGQLAWQVAIGSPVQGTPAIASGRVFVPAIGGAIIALGLADGAQLWSTDLGGLNASSPAIVNGDIIVGAGLPQQFVVRLNGTTGAVVWQSAPVLETFSNTPPAVAGGLVVVGTNGGHYYAFDAATGAARWDYRGDGIVNIASPLIAGGRVYLAGGKDSDNVHAVEATTGLAIAGWPVSLPAPAPDLAGTPIYRRRAVSSFVAAGGVIVLATRLDDALDTDGDGQPDHYLSRETAIALDPGTGATVWQRPLGRAVFTDSNDVPTFAVCPTPAAFATATTPLVAVASSLVATVSLLDLSSGNDQGDLSVAGRALASPVMANGRIITVAENGTVEGLLSSVNHPPAAPILAANPEPLDAAAPTLRWSAAIDPDAEESSYELRIDSDGELLQSYAQQIFPGVGATSASVGAGLLPGTTYTFAVRARDPHGALSPWSAPETFTVVAAGTVTVNGMPATSLQSAVEGAQPGDVILLGAGTFPLSEPLHVGGGVSLQGAGAGRTTLDATGLSVGVTFDASDPKSPQSTAGLDKATVAGADTCVSVSAGATGVRLTHLVVRDCATTGIGVEAGGGAVIVNATLVGDGTAIDAAGTATLKNSLVTANGIGLKSDVAGVLTSSYDDLFGNQTDAQGVTPGTGDFSTPVTFVDVAGHNLLLGGPQASTDRGDPADEVGAEPTPNGARINLGAFGGTADAEMSMPAAIDGQPVSSPTPTTTPPEPTKELTPGEAGGDAGTGGCAVGGRASGAASHLVLVVLAALLVGRRRSRGARARDARGRAGRRSRP